MQIKNGALLAIVGTFSAHTFAMTPVQTMPAITLQNSAAQAEGTLLTTLPLSSQSTEALSESVLSVETGAPLWDTSRGIFKTTIPGLGFSLCTKDNERCLSHVSAWIPGESLSLRLYKIGDLHGGRYLLPQVGIYGKTHPLLHVHLPAVVVNTALCGVTSQRIHVAFPAFALKQDDKNMPAMSFKIPVVCLNSSDYDKVGIQFTFHGKLIDRNTLPTQLDNIGIKIDDENGQPVAFNTSTSSASTSFTYRAKLITIPGRPAQSGKFSTDATVLITLR